jgi:hypothetical protein
MNYFWIIAIVNAAYIGFVLFTGRIRLKGWRLIDRDIDSSRYWTIVAVFIFLEFAVIAKALSLIS